MTVQRFVRLSAFGASMRRTSVWAAVLAGSTVAVATGCSTDSADMSADPVTSVVSAPQESVESQVTISDADPAAYEYASDRYRFKLSGTPLRECYIAVDADPTGSCSVAWPADTPAVSNVRRSTRAVLPVQSCCRRTLVYRWVRRAALPYLAVWSAATARTSDSRSWMVSSAPVGQWGQNRCTRHRRCLLPRRRHRVGQTASTATEPARHRWAWRAVPRLVGASLKCDRDRCHAPTLWP